MGKETEREPGATRLQIEYLFLDLNDCARCRGTDKNLAAAIETLRPQLEVAGIELSVRRVLVDSAEQAVRERLVTSPTVRINGRDIAAVEQTPCDSCGDLCGCEEGTLCRVWNYRGEQHSVAPIGLLIEAIADTAFSTNEQVVPSNGPQGFELPENLQRFFAGKEARLESASEGRSPCCDPGQCDCGGTCDCNELESADCGCDS